MKKLCEVMNVVTTGVKGFVGRDWTLEEKVLLVLDCVLFGVLLGALWSPKGKKNTTIASYNSAMQCDDSYDDIYEDYEDEE